MRLSLGRRAGSVDRIGSEQRVVGQAIGVIRIGVAAGERVDSLRRLSW
jgi:hypothetical protein